MERKLLAILGGPHKDGATGRMLTYAIEQAKAKGWKVDYLCLYEKNLRYCVGCNSCLQTGACSIKDDIVEISAFIQNCDMVILASPVYWANVPAAVKNLFDRLRGVAMAETATFPKPRLSKHQRYVLLTSCNTPSPFCSIFGQSSGAIRNMKEFFKTSGMTSAGTCVWSGKNKKEMPARIKRKLNRLF